ncbi:hypothetical protein BGW41_005400 [Actinomortierella wolfii]|nr:hypothetical protein BGW41_005400 [Actinomortierella wolfii]
MRPIFQAHHAERLEQIEMVLRQIAEKEQLKDDIIEQMQQSSRTLEQTGAHLELELAKARVAAISASLEFVQAEQEILIERALSTEDHSKRLEAIGRGSRATQQEMTQTQQRLQELAQLIFLEHEAVSDRLAQSKEDLSETEPLLTKMAQLSKERMNSVEQGCMATIQRLKQQQERLCGTREAFAPLLCSKQLEDSNLHAPETYVHNAPYLSQDRMALERVVQSFALILHTSLLTQLTETQGMMKDATEQLSAKWRQGTDTCKLALQRVHSEPQLDMNPGDESHQCDTRLETEASTAIETIEKCDDLHQEAAIHEIQQSLEQYDSAVATIQQIESLVQESQMLEDSPWVEK